MATVASLINMKGGVGKSTLTFNISWYFAFRGKKKVLCIDLDPQANLSQYFLGADAYLKMLKNKARKSIVDIFEQYAAPTATIGTPNLVDPDDVIVKLEEWNDGSLLHLIPSRLELAWTLKNPTEKAQLLPQFIAKVESNYDVILIDCAPTESILTNAAYRSSSIVFVPVKPEFLATIGLPLLAKSLNEYKLMHQNHQLKMGGIIFNDMRRSNTPPEQEKSCRDVRRLAAKYGWPVFRNVAYHSDSYAAGSRARTPIFKTSHVRRNVKYEFEFLASEFWQGVKK